ncbi:MAG: hypothetical protein ACRDRW_04510, partial [Pseudonocardiaceae bacterium]
MPARSTSMMAEITASCSVGAARSKKPRTVPSGSTENEPSSQPASERRWRFYRARTFAELGKFDEAWEAQD